MYDGWMSFAGVEIINAERVVTYANRLGIDVRCGACDTCPDLHEALGDSPYTSPDADDAPWFDPRFPNSKLFCGFLPLSVDGIDSGTGVREPTNLLEGAAIGPLRRAQREIVVRVLCIGADDCSASYGLSWLTSALRGAACAACAGDSMCVFSCCPEGDGDGQLRTMFDVGMLEAPTRVNTHRLADGPCYGICGSPGSVAIEVEFTLVAGLPHLYHEPTDWLMPPMVSTPGITDPLVCVQGTPCGTDPTCPPLPARPTVPIPADPCGCTLPSTALRSVLTVGTRQMARWLETVPVLRIETGSAPVRCLRVRFFTNPVDAGCATLDPCAMCAELGVSYLPANSLFVVDGRNRSYTLDCTPAQVDPTPNPPTLYTSGRQPYTWPVLDCPGGLCVELLAASAAPDLEAVLGLAAREDAS